MLYGHGCQRIYTRCSRYAVCVIKEKASNKTEAIPSSQKDVYTWCTRWSHMWTSEDDSRWSALIDSHASLGWNSGCWVFVVGAAPTETSHCPVVQALLVSFHTPAARFLGHAPSHNSKGCIKSQAGWLATVSKALTLTDLVASSCRPWLMRLDSYACLFL